MDTASAIESIKSDPRLRLLANAISELSNQQEVHEKTIQIIQSIIVEQQKCLLALNKSIQDIGKSVDLLVKQMIVSSQSPGVPQSFRGIIVK